jgi:hypothetical protein
MKNIEKKYLEGNLLAKDLLIDEIMKIYDFNIDRQEAEILLIKKYGKPNFF